MRVAVVGLGYVGSVTAACFASRGHSVVGCDVSAAKVDQINSGVPPVHEDGLTELTRKHVADGKLRATVSLAEAWTASEVLIVSVGTPSGLSGDVDLSSMRAIVHEMGDLLAADDSFKFIVITSTVPPGTLANTIRPTLEQRSGKYAGRDFGLAFSPEFLREGTAVRDFIDPEMVVIGADDDRSREVLRRLYGAFSRTPVVTTPEVAETVKFASNAWHALKVAFANEIGRIAQDGEIDSHEVMRIFKLDHKLNVSERYLTPGFAFGGSCLPKDLRTLTYRARSAGVRVPVLESILPSNDEHLAFALRRICDLPGRRVLVLGLAFKAGTDDLRESPAVPLVEALMGRGYHVRVFDEEVQLGKLVGANRSYLLSRLPHIAENLVTDPIEAVRDGELDIVVVAQPNPRFASVLEQVPESIRVIDLAGAQTRRDHSANYLGLTW